MPPFPATMPSQRIDNHVRVENLLRNYMTVNKQELNRLKGDLTAYRQEAQTAFRQNVAYPRPTVQVGDLDVSELENVLQEPEEKEEEEEEEDVGPTGGGGLTEAEIERMAILRQKLKERQFSRSDPLPSPPSQRGRRPSGQKSMKDLKDELRANGVRVPSGIKQRELHALAKQAGISLER